MGSNPWGGGTPINGTYQIPPQVPAGQLGGGQQIQQPWNLGTWLTNGVQTVNDGLTGWFNNTAANLFGGQPPAQGGGAQIPVDTQRYQQMANQNWSGYQNPAGNTGPRVYMPSPATAGQNGPRQTYMPVVPRTDSPYGNTNAPADPNAWANNPMWQYSQGGAGPFANVPIENWPDVADQLGIALPWAQMQQMQQRDQFTQGLQQQGFTADQAQRQWENQFQQGQAGQAQQNWQAQFGLNSQDQGFQQWLATQQLGQQGGAQQFDQAWRNRQLDLQQQQQGWGQGNWQQQFAADQGQQGWNNQMQQAQFGQSAQQQAFMQDLQSRGFTADQAQQQWNNQFQTGQAALSADQWNQQFGFTQQQANVANNQWNQQFGLNQQNQNWNQGYQDRTFDASYGLQRDQFGLQQQGQQFDQGFQQQQANQAANQWNQQFGLNAQGQQFNQGMAQQQFGADQSQRGVDNTFRQTQFDTSNNQWGQQFGETQRQFNTGQGNWQSEFGANRADTAWNQAMQTSQFDWQKQMADEQNKIAREGQAMASFGRRFAPSIAAM